MSMSIQERMALQARLSAASHRPPVKTSPEPAGKPSMSIAERIQRQAATAEAQKNAMGKAGVNEATVAYWHEKYAAFKAMVEEKLAQDPLYFEKYDAITGLPLDGKSGETSETKEGSPVEPEVPVVGVATAEGEVAITAPASEPVKDMPFQATPVIKTNRSSKKKKAEPKPVDPENDGVEEQATSSPFGVNASGESVGIQ